MVGIYKVKVRFSYLALAHVSHFFRTGVVGLQAIDAFSLFELFENLQLPALLLSLAPRVALVSRTRAVGQQAIDALFSFCNF